MPAMNQKPITFRCSSPQLQRLESAMLHESKLNMNRTDFISVALESFLSFVEKDDISRLNLFELVERIDRNCPGPPFGEQA